MIRDRPARAPGEIRRLRPIDALLLPLALVLVLLEDVVWRGALAGLNQVGHLRPVAGLAKALAGLPAWAALPLFLIPEAVGKLGELWAATLLLRGHILSAIWAYAGIRVVAAVIAVFIYRACEPALLRIRWFAVLVAWVTATRDWARALVAPVLARGRSLLHQRFPPFRRESWLVRRFRALRRRLAERLRRG